MWSGYCEQLQLCPLPLELLSGAVIFTTGDIVTQTIVEGAELAEIDAQRSARLACFRVVVTAYVHTWWGILEPRAALIFCPSSQKLENTPLNVFCDQMFDAGSFNIIFFGQTAMMEGRSIEEALVS